MNSIIIAAPQSGSGKTTVTLGIMECLRRRGLAVAPFKVGPDFIDPGYHRLVCGRTSINLDGWMCGADFVVQTFAHNAQDADFAVIEGVMGLFDGIAGASDAGSTAEISKILGAPVILVVDAKSQARSVAALVKGFAGFDPDVRIAGVIFNNVGSENHERILREAVEHGLPEVKVLGCLPRDERLHLPSRHLGLVTAEENPLPVEFFDLLAEAVERHVDVDAFANHPPFVKGGGGGFSITNQIPLNPPLSKGEVSSTIRIAVARDAAFCFVYEDNLRLLREAGAEIVEFSPLTDEKLPAGISGIYLPGGYPELFADALAANSAMKKAVRDAIEAGMPVYAECGGFIYLTEGVTNPPPPSPLLNQEGVSDRARVVQFAGIFPVTTRMLPRRKALGYREVELTADSILGPAGTVARGHEFHYSEMGEMPASVERLYRVSKHGQELGMEGYRHKNCLASYVHLHFGSNLEIARAFIDSCRNYDKRSLDR
ncbi:MAG: cobyrinate a,c-diamide synthase [Geobacter sp.]|nr:cobyrinate a,c-diamide synthase [Geobacter sp.]